MPNVITKRHGRKAVGKDRLREIVKTVVCPLWEGFNRQTATEAEKAACSSALAACLDLYLLLRLQTPEQIEAQRRDLRIARENERRRGQAPIDFLAARERILERRRREQQEAL